jgi:hypothetical protein
MRRIFRSFWMRLCLLLLIFTAGGVAGYSVGTVLTERRVQAILKDPPPESLTNFLKTSLALTEAQFPEVEKVIARRHAAMNKIRQQTAPQYVAVFEEMDQEMQAILDESQREIWKKKATAMREFWASGRPPGRGGRRPRGDQRPDEHRRDHDKSSDKQAGEKNSGEKAATDKAPSEKTPADK